MKKISLLGLTLFTVNVFLDKKLSAGYKLVGHINIPGNWQGFLHVEISIPFLPIIPDLKYAWEVS